MTLSLLSGFNVISRYYTSIFLVPKDVCPICDGIAPAGGGVRWNILLLQRDHPLHVQVHSAEQSGGDYRCRVCNGKW